MWIARFVCCENNFSLTGFDHVQQMQCWMFSIGISTTEFCRIDFLHVSDVGGPGHRTLQISTHLMAFRVRSQHSLALGVIGIVLVTYSSFYATPGRFYMQHQGKQPNTMTMPQLETSSKLFSSATLEENNSLKVSEDLMNRSSTAAGPRVVAMAVTEDASHNTTTKHVVFNVIQHIPAKASSDTASSPNSTTLDSSERGIITRSIYESGHDIANIELCPDLGNHLQLLIAITSAPNHKEARMAIRHTWGHYSHRRDVAIAFLLGSTEDVQLKKSLQAEGNMYGDLISARFRDSYNNLTLKTISMLEWVDSYCNRVKFVLKTDDDMFINVHKLLIFLEKHANNKRAIFGRLAKKWKPIRNKKSKYYVSLQQYQPSVFPDFTTGPAYLMTGDVIHDIYITALSKTYLKLEDVFITGIVAQDMKIKRFHVYEFFNKRIAFNACNIQKGISIHMVKYHEQFDLWKKLLDGRSKCK